jgi:peptidoglycan/xylan/chitin deacetylase (PgdA/CDA1 family)
MGAYWVKTPHWLKKLLPNELIWDIKNENPNTIYITFDDGPHPLATKFALEQLEYYDAHATFFCVGENVSKYPEVYQQILDKGNNTGNHTYNHLNGWKTPNSVYISNIDKASKLIESNLFRPPYGRLKLSQLRRLKQNNPETKICMWDILSGDFDNKISPQQCTENVLQNLNPGSIIIFHDSEKSFERMKYALPKVLEYCKVNGLKMLSLPY